MYEIQKKEELQAALMEMDSVVFKSYLDYVTELSVVPLETSFDDAVRKIRLRRLKRIVYDRNEDNISKFNSVFSAMHSSDSSVILILKGCKDHTDIYIGTNKVSDVKSTSGADALDTMDAAIKGNFPGMDLGSRIYAEEISSLLKPLEKPKYTALSSVAGVPSLKNEDTEKFSQGLEKIIDGMRGREYTAIIQATPVTRKELDQVESAYAKIHTMLSVFEQKQITFSENESRALGVSMAEGITKTLSESIGETQTTTEGSSRTDSSSKTKTRSDIDVKRALSGAASGAVSGGIAAAKVSGGLVAAEGAAIGALIGLGAGLFGGSKSESESISEGSNYSSSVANSTNRTSSDAETSTKTDSETTTSGSGKSVQITEKNRGVTALLDSIDNQMKRIKECKSYGMWSWSAYFIGAHETDVKLGADLYSGILRGESTGLERNSIAVWSRFRDEKRFIELQKYVAQLKHPVFKTPEVFFTPVVSHTALVSTKEMTVAMSFPRKSLPGIPVFDSVAFGRSVTSYDAPSGDAVAIGNIFNFGAVEKNLSVKIDIHSLTGHIFISGSTGAGKSNAIYSIVNRLYTEKNIPFLIIEPAKGEYKQIFGGKNGVRVFGTNPRMTPLLRLNPFSFPKNIHIMEHIDRLVEILNAVWPMYAAMPAILKEAIEVTYEKIGWDLLNSECLHKNIIFPDFYDLLETLPEIINRSDYSQEIKGNYAGALITRVKSLTNGYFKIIFQKDEIEPSVLFDQPCIADLSRVGSSETKSMLMGILFMKLQEYRMSEATTSNAELLHLTVLEEAHNLLRSTGTQQGEDSANLQGKSVEMISNAIAEMRTYGEGFIIADQAPGLLDPSAIRNTNTKIIFRLPDFNDRTLVGKSAHLSDEQIHEIARIPTGCAAIYQNNWQEPVLCQFEKFSEENPFIYNQETVHLQDDRKTARTLLLKALSHYALNRDDEKAKDQLEKVAEKVSGYYPSVMESTVLPHKELLFKAASVLELSAVLDRVSAINNIDQWIDGLVLEIRRTLNTEVIDENDQAALMRIVQEILSLEKPDNRELFEIKFADMAKRKGGLL